MKAGSKELWRNGYLRKKKVPGAPPRTLESQEPGLKSKNQQEGGEKSLDLLAPERRLRTEVTVIEENC